MRSPAHIVAQFTQELLAMALGRITAMAIRPTATAATATVIRPTATYPAYGGYRSFYGDYRVAVSVYFDTDELKLRDKGLSLRVRRIGRHHVQTIKPRNEWEHQISGGLSSKSGESRMPAASSERAASRRHSLPGREEAPIAYVLKDAQRAYRAFAKAKRFWL